MTDRTSRSPLPWLGGLLALYLVVPVVAFAVRLAGSHDRGFGQPGLFGALYVSVATATVSAAVLVVLGIPLAYALARSHGRVAAVVGALVQLPLALPPLMSGILVVELVGPYTVLGRAFGGHLTDSMIGIVLAQTFVAAPFLVISARSAFAAVDRSILEHASTLGHRELARFWQVSLPLAAPGIRAGLLLAWLRAFGEYGATVVLAYHPYTLPVYTYVQFSGSGIPTTQAPTALGLLVALAAASLGRLPHRRRRPAPSLPPPAPPRPSPTTPVTCALDVHLDSFHLVVGYAARTAHLAVLGPSGSGKSTTLRAIAGLLGPGVGQVAYGSASVDALPVEERHVGYVPQGYGLFPHLTVWQQLCFGVGADRQLAAHWLGRLHLDGLEHRFPAELSGGQRQRVALAQALARSPDLLLLDEPFSALDTPVRHELATELRRLQRETGLSTVLVTHDAEEAAYLADELLVLDDGCLLQAGRRQDIFSRPASPAVARLLGYRNLSAGRVVGPGRVAAGDVVLDADTADLPGGAVVTWSIRPEHVIVGAGGEHAAVALDSADLGAVTSLVVAMGEDTELDVRTVGHDVLPPGTPCRITLPPEAVRVWPA